MKKRQFLKRIGQAAVLSPFLPLGLQVQGTYAQEPYPTDSDDEFWKRIRKDYALKPDYINLENGYYNFAPQPTLNKFIEHVKLVNYEASFYMRTVQWDNKKCGGSQIGKNGRC